MNLTTNSLQEKVYNRKLSQKSLSGTNLRTNYLKKREYDKGLSLNLIQSLMLGIQRT